jgi:hypothetical protein
MRRDLFTGLKSLVQQFVQNLNGINRNLLYFPKNHRHLDQDEIIEILDKEKVRQHRHF